MISIIMPVFNKGNDLDISIPTILNQTYADYELICVDDASTDSLTQERLRYYGALDERVSLIFLRENKGAANARNIGFDHSSGEYVIFLDADDEFAPNMLEILQSTIEREQADVCICNYVWNRKDLNDKKEMSHHYLIPEKSFRLHDLGIENALTLFGYAPWNKLIRKDFLKKHDIEFQSLTSCNDVYFTCMALLMANKIVFPNTEGLIFWTDVQAKDKISSNRNPQNLFWAFEKMLQRLQLEQKLEWIKYIQIVLLQASLYELNKSKDEEKSRIFYQWIQSYLKSTCVQLEDNKYKHLADYYLEKPFESFWWKDAVTFEWKLERNFSEIMEQIEGHKKIFLWGLGERGTAFLSFSKKHEIPLYGIVDRKNDRVGEIYEKDFIIRHTDEIEQADYIIASNGHIWKSLCSLFNKVEILNLEEFC